MFAVVSLTSSHAMFAQTQGAQVFSAIPEERRGRLIERLRSLVQYQRNQQWSKQYELLSTLQRRAQSKQDFINLNRQMYSKWGRTPLVEFVPLKITLEQVDKTEKVLFIAGCSVVLEKGTKVTKAALVEAYWEKGDWFFSEVQNLGAVGDGFPCRKTP